MLGYAGLVTAIDTSRRLLWADIVRGLAILLVILHHSESQIYANLGSYPKVLSILNDAFAPFRMSLLMFLSGMLLTRSLSKNPQEYIKGKAANILWPYFIWSGLLLSAIALNSRHFDMGVFLSMFYNPPTYLWYLAYLAVFYMLALVITPPKARAMAIPIAMITAAVVPDPNWTRMCYLFAFFLLGDFCARHWKRIWRIATRPWVFIGLITLSAAASISSVYGIKVNYEPIWSVCVAAIIVPAAAGAIAVSTTKISQLLALVGRHSIVYYATHFLVLMIVFNVLEIAGFTNSTVLALLLPIVAVAVGASFVWSQRFPFARLLFAFPRTKKAPVTR